MKYKKHKLSPSTERCCLYRTLINREMDAWLWKVFIFTAQLLKSKEIKINKIQKVEAYRKDKKETCRGEIADSIPTRKNVGKVITERSKSWQIAEQLRESHKGTSQHHDKHQSLHGTMKSEKCKSHSLITSIQKDIVRGWRGQGKHQGKPVVIQSPNSILGTEEKGGRTRLRTTYSKAIKTANHC